MKKIAVIPARYASTRFPATDELLDKTVIKTTMKIRLLQVCLMMCW
jgi:CMP-2-keto-3-deoxyoctulosonic acid synthetase